MSWWSSVREVLSAAGRVVYRGAAPGGCRAPPTPTPAREPAWPYLRTVQRALAEPMRPPIRWTNHRPDWPPIRIRSFLAPLRHAVRGEFGGLVNGLADLAPGAPHPYRASGGLPVPASRRKPIVQRRAATWSSFPDGPAEVDEVSLEPWSRRPPMPGPTRFLGTGARTTAGQLSKCERLALEGSAWTSGAVHLSGGESSGALTLSRSESSGALSEPSSWPELVEG